MSVYFIILLYPIKKTERSGSLGIFSFLYILLHYSWFWILSEVIFTVKIEFWNKLQENSGENSMRIFELTEILETLLTSS